MYVARLVLKYKKLHIQCV